MYVCALVTLRLIVQQEPAAPHPTFKIAALKSHLGFKTLVLLKLRMYYEDSHYHVVLFVKVGLRCRRHLQQM